MLLTRKRTSPLKFIALLLVFTGSFFIGKFIADWGIIGNPQGEVSTSQGAELNVNRLNVLLLGIDARPGEKDARSDSMIIISIDRDTKKIAMVSVPRDTLVDIPGHGQNKINAANALGGAELARTTVEDLLDIEIPYYVKTNFDGFKEIVDTLGGVDINVEKRMYYPAENINLHPGPQRLDGYNALGYVRFRYDALGDISRTERQQKFLTALAKEMMQAKTIIKLPKLVPQIMAAVDTNLGVGDAIFLTRVASNLDSNNIVTATLPGAFYNYKGASYWKVDEAKAKVALNELFEGLKLATITGPDITVPVNKKVYKKPLPSKVNTEGQNPTSPGETGGTDGQTPGGTGNTEPGQDSSGQPNQDPNNPGSPGLPPDANSGEPGQNPDGQSPGQNPGSPDDTNDNNGPPKVNPPIPGVTNSSTDRGNTTSQNGDPGSASSTAPKVDIINEG